MKHLNLSLEKLEERIAPWGGGGRGSKASGSEGSNGSGSEGSKNQSKKCHSK